MLVRWVVVDVCWCALSRVDHWMCKVWVWSVEERLVNGVMGVVTHSVGGVIMGVVSGGLRRLSKYGT